MRRKLATFGLVALMLLACREFQASGAELPRDFSEKYGSAASKLQQLYTHATVTGTVRREYPTTGKWIEQRFVFKAAGRRFRLDCTSAAPKMIVRATTWGAPWFIWPLRRYRSVRSGGPIVVARYGHGIEL